MPRWPCELHPATESVSFPARPWLSLPPPAAAFPFADAASPPDSWSMDKENSKWWGSNDLLTNKKKKEAEKTKGAI